MLPLALLVLLLVEAAAALALAATAASARLAADRRFGVEAELMLGSALASARVDADSAIAALLPAERRVLPAASPAGWETSAIAERVDSSRLAVLVVEVGRRDGGGGALVQRRATLLLSIESADTALVLDSRSRW